MLHISLWCFRPTGWWPPGQDQDDKLEGELPHASDSCRPFALWGGTSVWPSIWRSAPDDPFTRSLYLGAIDMNISGCELKLQIQSFNLGTKALARNKTTTWFELATSLSHCLGLLFICHQWGSSQMVGMPPTREKGSHLPPWTTKLLQFKGWLWLCHSSPLPNQIWDSSPLCWAHPGMPEMWPGCTGMLDELVGSHAKVVIYPTFTICCERLWSVPCSILDSRGCR